MNENNSQIKTILTISNKSNLQSWMFLSVPKKFYIFTCSLFQSHSNTNTLAMDATNADQINRCLQQSTPEIVATISLPHQSLCQCNEATIHQSTYFSLVSMFLQLVESPLVASCDFVNCHHQSIQLSLAQRQQS